jgi:hypothetical protein
MATVKYKFNVQYDLGLEIKQIMVHPERVKAVHEIY